MNAIKKVFLKLKETVVRHKIWTVIVVVAFGVGGYFVYASFFSPAEAEQKYVLAAARKDTLISSISGTGQVAVSDEVSIKAKVSGEVISVPVKLGQGVKVGALIAQLDTGDARQSLRDAQDSLETAQLSLEKLQKPANELSLLQGENSLIQAKESKQDAEDNLAKAYDDGFNDVANAFLELPSTITGLQDIILGNSLKSGQWNIDYYADAVRIYDGAAIEYRDGTYEAYNQARKAYDKNFADYKGASRYSDKATIESLINETYDTTKSIAESVKSTINLIQFYEDYLTQNNLSLPAGSSAHLTDLNTYTSKTNSQLSSLLAAKQSIANYKQAIINADRTIAEKTASLADLKAGADELDLRTQELAVQQKRNAVLTAQEKLADYSIRAPFDGVISSLDAKKGDSLSSGGAVATIITKKQIVEISLNEVDVAKVKVGQKATLTLDAIEGLTLTGEVAQIDITGTASQGVVSYNVRIGIDTQDDRVKPGMSVSASIVTDIKSDVLVVPSSAIKTQGGQSYVQVVEQSAVIQTASGTSQQVSLSSVPARQIVVAGSFNDSYTEIISGLNEGDLIVSQTVSSASTGNTNSSNMSAPTVRGTSVGGMGSGGMFMIR